MSFLENIGLKPSLKEEEKIRTDEESSRLICEYLEDYIEIIDFKNHKSFNSLGRQNTYRFTVKMISLDFLSKLAKDKRVKNVFFSPSSPPPGGALDSISMRYKVSIEYH